MLGSVSSLVSLNGGKSTGVLPPHACLPATGTPLRRGGELLTRAPPTIFATGLFAANEVIKHESNANELKGNTHTVLQGRAGAEH